jgi:hypothetical protein
LAGKGGKALKLFHESVSNVKQNDYAYETKQPGLFHKGIMPLALCKLAIRFSQSILL